MFSEIQMDIMAPKMAQYQQDWEADEEFKKESAARLHRQWRDMLSDLYEWEPKEGDQERMLSFYKTKGYKLNRRVRADIYRIFALAVIIEDEASSAGRKDAVDSIINGEPGYGKKAADDIKETNDLMRQGKKKAAKADLLQKIQKRFFWAIGQLVYINSDVISWDDVLERLKKFIENWNIEFGPRVAANKAADA